MQYGNYSQQYCTAYWKFAKRVDLIGLTDKNGKYVR